MFVISAPSGTGKTTLIRRLLEQVPGIDFSVSFTTRPRRHDERDGVDYRFVDAGRFDRMIQGGDLLEWARVHGQRYGTSARAVERSLANGRDVLLDIDSQGAASIRRVRPEAVLIFILPPDFETLKARLHTRGLESDEEMQRRIRGARQESERYVDYDYVVINDSFETAARDLEAIVLAHRSRRQRQEETCRRILESFRTA